MDEYEIEVQFDYWCPKCIHKDLKETKDPCNECLDNPYNNNSTKPRFFKEAK